jgi:hypothetical protein
VPVVTNSIAAVSAIMRAMRFVCAWPRAYAATRARMLRALPT